ncbi:hypothetical protein MMC24_003296 [Lignoscripta atroalba]|nr:hypothetical protein [Lignoscripta atroalba]
MADREKDFSAGHHNGTLNPNYPHNNNASDSAHHNGTLNPNYPHHNGSEDSNRLGVGGYLHDDIPSDQALRRIKTAGSISISPELFEKIYLSPQNKVSGDLRKTFGNPTPIALVGFLISLTPLSCDLMGWRGAGGNGAAGIGSYYWFGGLLMFTGGLLEWVLGNTFPCVVFTSFGAFWLTFGSTLTPSFNAYGAYAADPAIPTEGLESPVFASSFAFFQLFMGLLCFVYLICSLRTNLVFVVIFATLVVAFCLLAATYWQLALGNAILAGKLQIAAGAFAFVTTMAGWWIFLAQMLVAVDFPFNIPVGDISHIITGATERQRNKDEYSA